MSSARQLADQAYDQPHNSPARRELLLQAVNAADAEQDVDYAFELRTDFISSMHANPSTPQMVAAFAWCLARQDEDPERFTIDLWYYKWVINAVLSSANTSTEQVTSLIDDMERRYTEVGASRGPVLKARLEAVERFDRDRIVPAVEQWLDTHRVAYQALNDCSACDDATEGNAWRAAGEHERAITAAAGLLDGSQRCASQPHATLGWILDSFRALGRDEEADLHHRKGLDLIRNKLWDFPSTAGHHLRHMAVRGRIADGLDLLVAAHPSVRIDDMDWFQFLRGARLVLAAAERDGIEHPEADALRSRLAGEAARMADVFDRSEGSDHNTRLLDADDRELAAVG